MKLRRLAVGLFVTAAALFISVSAVWAATAMVEVDGTAIELEGNGMYQVMTDDGQTVHVPMSGKMRMYYVRILPGDKVRMELSPDTMKGRIIYRYK